MRDAATVASESRRKDLERLFVEAEWRRCARDKRYCFETYFYIPSAEAELGRCLFELKEFQAELVDALDEHAEIIEGKARQLGLTTTTMADSFHNGFFHDSRYELLVVSKSQDDAKTNLSMVEHIYRFLPQWMKDRGPQRVDDSSEVLTFKHRSGALFKATSIVGTPTRGAGKTANRVVLDEYALMNKPSQIFRALQPATQAAKSSPYRRGAVFVIISTFRGAKNAHARQFQRAWAGEDSWHAVFHPVTKNFFLGPPGSGLAAERVAAAKQAGVEPDPDDVVLADAFWAAWRAEQQSGAYADDPAAFFTEYPRTLREALRESGRNRFRHLPDRSEVFDFPHHGWIRLKNGKATVDLLPPDAGPDEVADAPWHFNFLPDEWPRDGEIVVGADGASGVLGDDSAAVVLADADMDGGPGATVLAAFWRNDVSPADFAAELNAAGRYFAPAGKRAALLAIERTPGGGDGEIITRVKQARYPTERLYRHRSGSKAKARLAADYGYPTNKATKPEAVRAVDRLLPAVVDDESGELVPAPRVEGLFPELLDQLESFVILNDRSDTSYEKLGADAGCHDDLVMAFAIAAVVLEGARDAYRGRASRPSPPSGEKASSVKRLPDGPFVLWNPGQIIVDAKAAARRAAHVEDRQWEIERRLRA